MLLDPPSSRHKLSPSRIPSPERDVLYGRPLTCPAVLIYKRENGLLRNAFYSIYFYNVEHLFVMQTHWIYANSYILIIVTN